MVKALLSDLAASKPKPQKNALVSCIERGFPAMLQNAQAGERGAAKATLVERLNREEGLDTALCADTLDMLDAALFGERENGVETARSGNDVYPACGAVLSEGARFCFFCGTAQTAVNPVAQNMPRQHPVSASPARPEEEVWRELRTLEGHTDWVWSVAYSPDGCTIVSGSYRTIKI